MAAPETWEYLKPRSGWCVGTQSEWPKDLVFRSLCTSRPCIVLLKKQYSLCESSPFAAHSALNAMTSWAHGGERGIRECLEVATAHEGCRDMCMCVMQGFKIL